MADLPIPAEAMGSVAEAICLSDGYDWALLDEDGDDEPTREEYRANARAAFVALGVEEYQRLNPMTDKPQEWQLRSRWFPVKA